LLDIDTDARTLYVQAVTDFPALVDESNTVARTMEDAEETVLILFPEVLVKFGDLRCIQLLHMQAGLVNGE
jgi:hypothetical protein